MPLQLNKAIVLVGLMGCGKSAIGKRLAEALQLEFIDIDKQIERDHDKSISQIFAEFGEDYFRQKEKEKIKEIIGSEPKIIATGGGAFVNDEVRDQIKQDAISVWIKADLEMLLERVSKKNTRPLLNVENKQQVLEDLMNKRYPIYEMADFMVETTNGPHSIVVNKIIDLIK